MKALVDSGRPLAKPPILERIAVPADIGDFRHQDVRRARLIQQDVSAHFLEYFDRDLIVVGVERSPEAGTYLFGSWESTKAQIQE